MATITVQRNNIVLEVDSELKQRYLNEGYNIINAKGQVVEKAIPTDIAELRKAYVMHTKTIKRLESEIKKLKANASENAATAEKQPTAKGRKSKK